MEKILFARLSLYIEEIKSLTIEGKTLSNTLNEENRGIAKITAAKLKSLLSQFSIELHNYLNNAVDPQEEIISRFTLHQIHGDMISSELETKLNTVSNTTKELKNNFSKLPDINLPKFDGNLLEWHQFWDQFTSMMNGRKMNDVDKLLYLKSSLKGEAAKLVDGFSTTNRNYQIVVDTLKERYGKEEEIINQHEMALNDIKETDRYEDCQRTLDDIQKHIRILESLGSDINTNQTRNIIMKKFPTEIIYELKMKMNLENSKSVKDILKYLSIIITMKEEARKLTQRKQGNFSNNYNTPNYSVEALHIQDQHRYNNNNFRRNLANKKMSYPNQINKINNRNDSMKRKLVRENDNHFEEKRKRFMCIFCEKNHLNLDCNTLKTAEERKAKIKTLNRCFLCFKTNHKMFECNSKKLCNFCKRNRHNSALCPIKFSKKNSTNVMHVSNKRCNTILQTAITEVRGYKEKTKSCRILLDCGSQRSYITQKVAKELDLQIQENHHLTIFTFGSENPRIIESPLVKFSVKTRNKTFKVLYANIVPSISQGVQCLDQSQFDSNIIENYKLADDGSLSDRVDILLGNDYYHSIISMKKICIDENLYLIESEFGWIVSGIIQKKTLEQMSIITYFQCSCKTGLVQPDLPLDNGTLKLLWDLEAIGITDSPKINRDEEAIKHFNETTIYKDKRYYVSWPWITYPPKLSSNFGLSFGRLVNLIKKLDENTISTYDQTLKQQLEKGIIEVVPSSKQKESHPIHYIPHHGVLAPGKALRIVYDASAKTKDYKSLNECLYCGPMLLEDLTGLIIKFRSHIVGITADVEKAFLQIGLKEADRDVTRFLWLKNIKEPATEKNLIHYRFTRVPFGIISSPFMLNASIKHHILKNKNEDVRKLAIDIYVDNVVTGTDTPKEAILLYKTAKEAFKEISMNLREWSSNSKEFIQHVPDALPDKVIKLLGLTWNLEEDTIKLRIKMIKDANTKRGILKSIASVFDPCGFAAPILLSAKIMLQDLWKLKLKWDATLPKEIQDKWNDIQINLIEVIGINLKRCYKESQQDKDYQLHCFTDSSNRAYAAVIYIVGKDTKNFVIGKSRLVPIKDQDNLKIPRLELLGVLIGTRLIQYVLKFINLKITQQILWTDSQIVISWIKSNKLLSPFVSRRIEEIKRNKDLIIRHVPSELNPADVATRPIKSKSDLNKWLIGPDFLTQTSESWPGTTFTENTFLVEDTINFDEIEVQQASKELECNKKLDKCTSCTEGDTLQTIKMIQNEHFKEEMKDKTSNLSRTLGLFKDSDGILRCKGRFKNAEWPYDKRYPIILPKDCNFTKAVIKKTHEKNYHVGANHTLSLIRQAYWIPHGKRQVQKVIRKCPRCIKHNNGPYKLPPTPALPYERVNYSKPFTFTGIDYLGPILVSTENNVVKRWICLYTCLAVRAIHLEVVQDLSAEEGILALRRMISTRGAPTLITSDNALHFKLMADILSNSYCVKNKIEWRFIPELAPWFGGFYERLIGLVKQCMRRTLEKHLLKDNQLSTIIKEIEAVINTRPLTCVDSEQGHILSPSDFLQVGKCILLETTDDQIELQGMSTKNNLIQTWRKARILLEEFKEMFQNRYLPSLRERYSHSHKQPRVVSKLTPKEGQVVQIKGDKNREGWLVGKIISLIKGTDGLCRIAQVKVGEKTYTRSLGHLYPLEIEEDHEPETCENNCALQQLPLVTNHENSETNNIENETTAACEIEMNNEQTDNDINPNNQSSSEVNSTNEPVTITENRQRKPAAVRALQKIKEWTQNLLMQTLEFSRGGGSQVN